MNLSVSIIILNWNGWKDTIECLESLYKIKYPNYNVIVVDNGSNDDSIKKIKEYSKGEIEVKSKFFKHEFNNKPIKIIEYDRQELFFNKVRRKNIKEGSSNKQMILIKNEKNYGFAEGNNIGIKYALKTLDPDYLLLLNNDTIVDKYFLNELVKVAESDREIGIVGPKIYYYDHPDIIQHAGGMINMWKGKRYVRGYRESDSNQYDQIENVDFITGATLLIKSKVIKKIGVLDIDYFTYTEDVDLCYRASESSYKILYVPKSKIWHKVSKSTGNEMSPTSMFLMVRNTIIFMKKNAKIYQCYTYIVFSIYYFLRRYIMVDRIRKKSMMKGVKTQFRNIIHYNREN